MPEYARGEFQVWPAFVKLLLAHSLSKPNMNEPLILEVKFQNSFSLCIWQLTNNCCKTASPSHIYILMAQMNCLFLKKEKNTLCTHELIVVLARNNKRKRE
jgi:hypothetical protein